MIKIPDTLQEIFDIVSIHLMKQYETSFLKGKTCAYRGDRGLKCAAGILIPNNEYKPEFEKKTWHTLTAEGFVENKFSDEIRQLQIIHDFECCRNWCYKLTEFAKKHNLQVNFSEPNEPIEV